MTISRGDDFEAKGIKIIMLVGATVVLTAAWSSGRSYSIAGFGGLIGIVGDRHRSGLWRLLCRLGRLMKRVGKLPHRIWQQAVRADVWLSTRVAKKAQTLPTTLHECVNNCNGGLVNVPDGDSDTSLCDDPSCEVGAIQRAYYEWKKESETK